MILSSVGSGSKGNCFAITTAGQTILVDAGFGPRTVQKRLRDSGHQLGHVVAVAVTHEHGDHSRAVDSLARRFRCEVIASKGTLDRLRDRLGDIRTRTVSPHSPLGAGPFSVTGCPTSHDAAEPMAFLVEGPEQGQSVGFAYDLGRPTSSLRFLLKNAACLVIESNHDEELLRSGEYPPAVQQRIAGSAGHLSNRATARLLDEIVQPGLKRVLLAHLSDRCNDPELALRDARRALQASGYVGQLDALAQDAACGPYQIGPENVQLKLGQTA
ncbi:MAG: MBL fold metallo-hydrolase [Gemmatimonadetes bacterium]|nr:MBL fold metallo-hydrolase [Gemmatimonadota bacterium]